MVRRMFSLPRETVPSATYGCAHTLPCPDDAALKTETERMVHEILALMPVRGDAGKPRILTLSCIVPAETF